MYDTEKALAGRSPYTIIEIESPYITDVLAAENPDGSGPCYNTPATARGFTGYSVVDKIYTFGDVDKQVPAGVSLLPSLISFSARSPRIAPAKAEGIGMRGGCNIIIQDHPHHDIDTDPYVSERAYNPRDRGSYWGKWLARNPYYQGVTLRVRQGFIVDGVYSPDNFRDATYHVERINGPDSNGRVTLSCSDVLQFTDGDRAQCPRVSSGRFLHELAAGATIATLTPSGAGAAYAAFGIIRASDELMLYTRIDDVLTLTRSVFGTEEENHDADTRVQECVYWDAVNVLDIIYDLLVNHAGINPSFVDLMEWKNESGGWLALYNLTAILSEPEGINDLLAELSEQCLLYLWWDAESAKVRLRAVAPYIGDKVAVNDTYHIRDKAGQVQHKVSDRLTDVVVYFGLRTPVHDLKEEASYYEVVERADDEAASDWGSRKVRTIYSRWFSRAQRVLVVAMSYRIATRFRDGTKSLPIKIDTKDDVIVVGDVLSVTSDRLQDGSGSAASMAMQVVEAKRLADGDELALVVETYSFLARYCLIADTDMAAVTYDTATDEQREIYGFIADGTNTFSDGSSAYVIG